MENGYMSINVQLEETGTTPFIIHANGKSKKSMSGKMGNEVYTNTEISEGNLWPNILNTFFH